MAADDGLGEKTEPATPKRREEARDKGQVAKSQDLTGAVSMLVGFATLKILGGWFGGEILAYFRAPFAALDAQPMTFQDMGAYAAKVTLGLLFVLSPVLGVLLLVAAAVPALQVGFRITPQAFEFKPDKMNPIKGIGRIFSLRSLVKLAIGIVKITLVALVLVWVISGELPNVMGFMGMFDAKENNTGKLVVYLLDLICWLGIYAGGTLTVIGILDYTYQRWQHEQDLKMSKQEIKDEMKNMEGDPHIKRKRLERARALAQKRMMNAVPEADVVVTNPTHYSVALRYKSDDPAPRVVAKGADRLALKIREIAAEHNVPIVEKPELARALYRWVEVDELIPADYWTPVAEVLSYVYKVDQRRKKRALGAEAEAAA